jgi:hypothetical protein
MATTGKLIVLAAFDRNDEGDLLQAFDPRQVDSEDHALRDARQLVGSMQVSSSGVATQIQCWAIMAHRRFFLIPVSFQTWTKNPSSFSPGAAGRHIAKLRDNVKVLAWIDCVRWRHHIFGPPAHLATTIFGRRDRCLLIGKRTRQVVTSPGTQ